MTQLIASDELAIGCEIPSSLVVMAPHVGAFFLLISNNQHVNAASLIMPGG